MTVLAVCRRPSVKVAETSSFRESTALAVSVQMVSEKS